MKAAALNLGLIVLLLSLLDFTDSTLPAYPLAVRSPYVSAWLPGSKSTHLPTAQAEFWTGNQVLGWSLLARVDGRSYTLFGAPNGVAGAQAANQLSITYTSTRTTATMVAGSAMIIVDFFSPVSPNNFIRQSLPFSYLTVTVSGVAGATPAVQILNTIDDTWTGLAGKIQSARREHGNTMLFTLTDPAVVEFTETKDMAAWGSAVLATQSTPGSALHFTSGAAQVVYSQFVGKGELDGNVPAYEAGDLVAFSHSLGKISQATATTFAVGHYRENSINYLGKPQIHYYRSKYATVETAVAHFLSDYDAAYSESQDLDRQIKSYSEAVSSKYSSITTAAVRQVFGAMEVTLPAANPSGASDPYVFLKEISSDGNVNTIDVIYPSFPILSVLCPDWIRFLLEPVAAYLETGDWKHNYVIHDLGSHYPNAIGHNLGNAENVILEVTGGFMVLVAEYQRLTGDKSWAASHSALFQTYADYLVKTGLYPPLQRDTVDSIPATANQTNLAIVSAIGLNAYATFSGKPKYAADAKRFANTIYTDGLGLNAARTHFTYNYHKDASWGTIFNLFPDQLLGLDTFPAKAREMQCKWYNSQKTPVGFPYAYADIGQSNGMLEMWVAATCDAGIRGAIVDDEYAFLNNGLNDAPFPDRFYVGGPDAGKNVADGPRARPTLGSTFAILALNGIRIN